jgi:hypothetical protein
MKADLPWCKMEVWYDPEAITNVLSFAESLAVIPVMYNNGESDEFPVKTSKGVLKFSQILKNLYAQKPSIKKTN